MSPWLLLAGALGALALLSGRRERTGGAPMAPSPPSPPSGGPAAPEAGPSVPSPTSPVAGASDGSGAPVAATAASLPATASAVPTGSEESLNVGLIISCMAVRPSDLATIWPAPRPKLIEWPGEKPAGALNPSWDGPARALRQADGRLLPALLRRYGIDPLRAPRIAVVGFSAGANNGLRNLLRHPGDRELLQCVVSLDGIHAATADKARWTPAPDTHYLDWAGQMGPLAETALRAAANQCICVVTASDVARPHPTVSKTAEALGDLVDHVKGRFGLEANIPSGFAEVRPAPIKTSGAGNFAALWYAGNQASDHVAQARQVGPAILKTWLRPLWGSSPAPNV